MHTTMTTWCARGLLALMSLSFAASAQASTIYNFTFTNYGDHSLVATGSFTTNGAAVDPGYELVASITFDQIVGAAVYTGPFTATTFEPGSAYNPTTGAFVNHSSGNTYANLGLTTTYYDPSGRSVDVRGFAFEPGGSAFDATIPFAANERILEYVTLAVTPAAAPAVPEPTSLLLLGTGLLGAVVSRRRGTR